MTNWLVAMEVATNKDTIETPKGLSMFLQNRNSTAITAKFEMNVDRKAQGAMKNRDRINISTMKDEFSRTSAFKRVPIAEPSEAKIKNYTSFCFQFFQVLMDNMGRRFDDKWAREEAAVVNPSVCPAEKDVKILFGDDTLPNLCKTVKKKRLKSSYHEGIWRTQRYTAYVGYPEENAHITTKVVISLSNAGCERGFHTINLILND